MKNFKRIEKYLDNEMSESQKKHFEAEVLIDNELAEELEFQKDLNDFLRRYIEKEKFRKLLDKIHKKYISGSHNQEQNSDFGTSKSNK